MVSSPVVQIAFALLQGQPGGAALSSTAPGGDLRRDARQLAALISPAEVCPACWRMASNGTAGKVQHNPESLCVWGE